MARFGSFCLVVAAAVLLAYSSGQETSLAQDKSRPVRAVRSPAQGTCRHITLGGSSRVHYYVCCNNCNENGGNPTCDRVTYQAASTGQYCGHCGADIGNGKWGLRKFKCGGCAGQSEVKAKCKKKYPWLIPGFCWVFSNCFVNRCVKRFHQRARSLDSDEGFCGDDNCGPGESSTTCPFDCCPMSNPGTCGRTNGTCPPVCCSETGCCRISGSIIIKGESAVVLATISMVVYTWRWLFD